MTLCVASSGRFFMSRTVPPFSVRPVKWNRPVPVNANRPDRPDFASSTGHRRKNGYRKIPCKKNRTSGMAYGAGYRHSAIFRLLPVSVSWETAAIPVLFRPLHGGGPKVWIPFPFPSGFCAFSFRRMVFPFLSGIGPSPFAMATQAPSDLK